MNEKVFMLNGVKYGENEFGQGLVYAVDRDTKKELVGMGNAVVLDFNRLDAIELSIIARVNGFKQEKDKLKNSPAYNDAESLRNHEIKLLEEKLEVDVAKLKSDYLEELDLYEKEYVKKALTIEHKTDTNTASMLDSALIQMQYGSNVELQLQLLAIKVSGMDTAQKLTLMTRLPEMEEVVSKVANVNGNAIGYLERIKDAVKDANPAKETDLRLQQLSVLRRDYANSVDLPFKAYKRNKGEK